MKVKVAACQIPVSEDKLRNIERARTTVQRAVADGAQIVVLPEGFSCPYSVDSFRKFSEPIPDGPSTRMLCEEALKAGVWIVGGTVMENDNGAVYNSCPIISPAGVMVAKHRKVHLFDVDIPPSDSSPGIKFQESSVISAGNSVTCIATEFGSIAVGICFDMRFSDFCLRSARANNDTFLLCFPGAFNMTTGPMHWELLLRARALDTQCFVVACAPSRGSTGYISWAHSMIVHPLGNVLADAGEAESVISRELEVHDVAAVRAQIPRPSSCTICTSH